LSLHAAVRVEAHDRKRLEQLCRYITRPALSDERVQCNAAGQVELKLKTPWRDGTTHWVMSPMEFMRRLAALVPRPRLNLIRFQGEWRAPSVCRCSRVTPCSPCWQLGVRREHPMLVVSIKGHAATASKPGHRKQHGGGSHEEIYCIQTLPLLIHSACSSR